MRRQIVDKSNADFNPRTHKECDRISSATVSKNIGISIHALTKSATPPFFARLREMQISIHALTKSATRMNLLDFQFQNISIHALT